MLCSLIDSIFKNVYFVQSIIIFGRSIFRSFFFVIYSQIKFDYRWQKSKNIKVLKSILHYVYVCCGFDSFFTFCKIILFLFFKVTFNITILEKHLTLHFRIDCQHFNGLIDSLRTSNNSEFVLTHAGNE